MGGYFKFYRFFSFFVMCVISIIEGSLFFKYKSECRKERKKYNV